MSLLLTIDLGNTNTVLGVFEGTELRAHWRLATRREQTADEYGILVRNLLASSGLAPAGVVEAVSRVRGRVPVEVSGGITLATVRAYAEAGADYIAIGALTHSAPAADISLEIDDA